MMSPPIIFNLTRKRLFPFQIPCLSLSRSPPLTASQCRARKAITSPSSTKGLYICTVNGRKSWVNTGWRCRPCSNACSFIFSQDSKKETQSFKPKKVKSKNPTVAKSCRQKTAVAGILKTPLSNSTTTKSLLKRSLTNKVASSFIDIRTVFLNRTILAGVVASSPSIVSDKNRYYT